LQTPAQQVKFDTNPRGFSNIEERRYVEERLKSSHQIAAKFGTVAQLTLKRWVCYSPDAHGHALRGNFVYDIRGSLKSDNLTISWQRKSQAAPIVIVEVEGGSGSSVKI
jgi:hypothetical protein